MYAPTGEKKASNNMAKGGGKGAPRPKSGSGVSPVTKAPAPKLRQGPGSVSGNSVSGTGKGGHK